MSTLQPGSIDVAPVSLQNEPAPAIFLSYSERQKGFVERLHDELVIAGHNPFFDRKSVTRAVSLPEYIKRSARESKLGVVVLSPDFLTMKWPMMELEILTNSRVHIFPVFYELSPNYLKNPLNLREWRQKWKIIAAKEESIDLNNWEIALKSLSNWSGEVFPPNTSEALYIQKIVLAISNKIPSVIIYDVSYAKGFGRLTKEMGVRFNHAELFCKSRSRACVIGLYGIEGFGKTTICKMMVNFYNSQYAGKCELMVFPSKIDKDFILKECKKIIKCFTSMNEAHLDQVNHFDKAMQVMREHMKLHKVFLALDNVSENSLEEAKRILKVGFAPGSKLLVTSRSEVILQDLLIGCDSTCVGCVPGLDQKEALELVSEGLLDGVVGSCLYHGSYNPRALKVVDRRLRRMKVWVDAEEPQERGFCLNPRSERLLIEEVAKSTFESIPFTRKCIFLDVAVTFQDGRNRFNPLKETRDLLRILYSDVEIDKFLEQVAFKGLARIEGDKIVVNDMYLELAQKEAASSCRFLLGETTDMETIQWAKLERVILRDGKVRKAVEQQCCQNVQVLIIEEWPSTKKLRLGSMTSLRVLELRGCTWTELLPPAEVESLTQLQRVVIESSTSTENYWNMERALNLGLGRCCLLKSLELSNYGLLDRDCLPALTNLQTLHLVGSGKEWEEFPDLSELKHLESLVIRECHNVRWIGNLPINLRKVGFTHFRCLIGISNIVNLVHLREMKISECGSLICIDNIGYANMPRIQLDDLSHPKLMATRNHSLSFFCQKVKHHYLTTDNHSISSVQKVKHHYLTTDNHSISSVFLK